MTEILFGVLFLSVVDKGLQLLGLSLSSVYAIKGGVILFAAVTDAMRHKLLARRLRDVRLSSRSAASTRAFSAFPCCTMWDSSCAPAPFSGWWARTARGNPRR